MPGGDGPVRRPPNALTPFPASRGPASATRLTARGRSASVGEAWYPAALAAIGKADAGEDSPENRRAYMPFFYGRWDEAARAHADVGVSERSGPVREGFAAEGAFRPAATRAEAGRRAAPVLVYAGELDTSPTPGTAAAAAKLFPDATVTVQPGAAHFPWLDDPVFFTVSPGQRPGEYGAPGHHRNVSARCYGPAISRTFRSGRK